MARGDHIYVERLSGVYAHHGIDTGDGWVIHYTGKNWRDPRKVQRTTIEDFAQGGEILIKDYHDFFEALKSPDTYRKKSNYQINRILNRLQGIDLDQLDPSPDAVIDRAEARIGERAFSIIFHNCEHFSSWCKTGISNSEQVNAVWKATMSTPDFARYRAENLLINLFEPKWPGRR
jgi:Lecithin retinol acyltransferase